MICDPLSHQTDLNVVAGLTAGELAEWFRSHGLLVVETYVRAAPSRPAPIRPFTCVEAVKRILGIHAPRVLTPWQLYRLLARADESLDMITLIRFISLSASATRALSCCQRRRSQTWVG